MAFEKKTWKNRIAEYINRRLLTKEDGSTELVTVARDEGQVSQEGDAFNADNMNDLEQRISDEFDSLNQSLNTVNSNLSSLRKISITTRTFTTDNNGNIDLGNNGFSIYRTLAIYVKSGINNTGAELTLHTYNGDLAGHLCSVDGSVIYKNRTIEVVIIYLL